MARSRINSRTSALLEMELTPLFLDMFTIRVTMIVIFITRGFQMVHVFIYCSIFIAAAKNISKIKKLRAQHSSKFEMDLGVVKKI